jgi:hypothetical protein
MYFVFLCAFRHKTTYGSGRATTGDVRDYYEEYVNSMGLKEHFLDHHVVTSVQKVFRTRNDVDRESGEEEPYCQNISQNHQYLWEVRGYRIIPSRRVEEEEEEDRISEGSVSEGEKSDSEDSVGEEETADTDCNGNNSLDSNNAHVVISPGEGRDRAVIHTQSSCVSSKNCDKLNRQCSFCSDCSTSSGCTGCSDLSTDSDEGQNNNSDSDSGKDCDNDKGHDVCEKKSSKDNAGSASPRSVASADDLSELLGDMQLQGEREEFCYVARQVVLATGTYDIPNRLGVVGEKESASVLHSLCTFEQYLAKLESRSSSAPVCVVGAGLSAADAILMALEAGLPVIHVFRCGPKDPGLIFRRLPQAIYPEYHRVAQLMRGEMENELYQAYPYHKVVEIAHDMVLLKPTSKRKDAGLSRSPSPPASDSSFTSIDVSITVVMIGSRPDLTFLKNEGRDLGVVPRWPIDSKHNPVDVDPFTYQSTHEYGLYAMGPLMGDNFVRFGIGGALGITNHLCSNRAEQ